MILNAPSKQETNQDITPAVKLKTAMMPAPYNDPNNDAVILVTMPWCWHQQECCDANASSDADADSNVLKLMPTMNQ